ncbi:MAG: hypothetical protein COU47_02520 [Candidatus Niyogibacteria bacterium CG10_big_fil_rev_8_21_14_0_10_46_36]|uniref:Uncharacterized protein n=1 Tax=Candidatus Niyogibacteria bacterium CG10_big_fil_rev_8_21_14_0_10_46_36 TaxID=1974726 RepID=A0A2H0TDJ2_9BACT|nr:MAG: hypothetical protein COU47_02520 [Candidatus Niyogibacteria bacterium CG10_big_fil_rev_8_21_14_0_10_46_36]
MNELASAIHTLIETHERFLIATRPQAQRNVIFAREALRFALATRGAKAIALPELSPSHTSEWAGILPPKTPASIPAKIIISLPKNKTKEVQYKEHDDTTTFVITPKEKMDAKDITVREELPEVDVAFFFFPYEDSFRNEVIKHVSLPSKEKMVFLLENEKTMAEKIYTISESTTFRPEEEIVWATLLYCSLVLETDNFRIKTNADSFHLAEQLVKRGANTDALAALEEQKEGDGGRNLSYAQILGRALARTQVDEATHSSWTFLTQKDFQKSGIQSDKKEVAVKDVLEYIERIVPRVETSFLLWEGNPHVSCIIKSKNNAFISRCAATDSFSCARTVCRGEDFSSFTHAELKIRELLKETKYDTIM